MDVVQAPGVGQFGADGRIITGRVAGEPAVVAEFSGIVDRELATSHHTNDSPSIRSANAMPVRRVDEPTEFILQSSLEIRQTKHLFSKAQGEI